ncbi:MAG: CooT family nickel-binding protein [Candidatus Lokiarchaeota archaeon]|jgi:predicted RNA-binding protein|nr:CooT family nickel-binding protein [Candidatus Lokiarchaeota archaeon]
MCEFNVSNKSDKSQIAEEILVLSYSDDKVLQLRDILGVAEQVESGLIYDVNTLDQTCSIIQHPIVQPFVKLIDNLSTKSATSEEIDELIEKLKDLKAAL